MCGIIGYTGNRDQKTVLLNALETLEYRGYDSAGIAIARRDGSGVEVIKNAGRVSELRKKCERIHIDGCCGIGHTRWATHGGVNHTNAHPHTFGNVTLIHNGIIENYLELKEKYHLEDELRSETDSEVVAGVINCCYEGDPKTTLLKVVRELKGTFALAIIFADHPDTIYAIRNVSPVIIAKGKDEAFLASDVTALSQYTDQYFVLPEYSLAELCQGKITVYDEQGEAFAPKYLRLDWKIGSNSKEGYDYYMEKEIMEQPRVIVDTILPRIHDGLIDFSVDKVADNLLNSFERISIIGCGTAMHAGLAGKALMQSLLKVHVNVEVASEFIYSDPVIDKDTLIICISQSGETIDSLEALRYAKRQGASVLSIVNVKGSTIARESDYVIYTNAGPEMAVASTKAYTTQLTVLYMLTYRMAFLRGCITEAEMRTFVKNLVKVPEAIGVVLNQKQTIHELAGQMKGAEHLFMIGRGLDYVTLLEASLKLKEISYIHSECYASGELKHGTIALITEQTPVIALVTQDKLQSKELSNAIEVHSRGADVFLFVKEGMSLEHADQWETIFRLPVLEDQLMIYPAIVALQLLSFYVSADRGLDVDKPRNLAKVVTVE